MSLTILNLGIDGALVAAAEPLHTGDRLDLVFRLPDDPVELGGLLDVRWAEHVHERGEDVWLAGGAFVPPLPIAGMLG